MTSSKIIEKALVASFKSLLRSFHRARIWLTTKQSKVVVLLFTDADVRWMGKFRNPTEAPITTALVSSVMVKLCRSLLAGDIVKITKG